MNQQERPLGLIGLGLLGNAMAQRLLQHGYLVRGYDRDGKRQDALAAVGGQAMSNAEQVFESCELVLLSLPTSNVVNELLQEVQPNLRADQTLIDTTTGNPAQMHAIGEWLSKQSLHYVEATVAGSSEQMRAGAAVLFLGGDTERIQQAQPIWAALSAKHFHLGPVGAASRFKLVHNLVLGLHRAVLAEGLSFAESLGFDPKNTLEILRQTPAGSGVMATKGQKMVDRNWETQAKLSQHLKDVRLILETAKQMDSFTPLSQLHRELLEQAERLGFGEADNSAILEVFSQRHN